MGAPLSARSTLRSTKDFEFPPEQAAHLRKAVRLEYVTIIYIVTSAALLFLTMGSSQAMRTSFFEDAISLVPSLVFLTAIRLAVKPPDADHPYGYHGVVSIGYLTASLALLGMGVFLLAEAAIKVLSGERTTIGAMNLFGHTVWAGWPMLAAIAYSAAPAPFLGRLKSRLAPKIHDKVLHAGAQMMKADWMAETATAIGVTGVGLGYWWIDPLAAAFVSLDIIKDGLTNLRVAVDDLIERTPMKTDRSEPDPLPAQLQRYLTGLDWVADAEVRLREVGHVYFGEAFVIPRDNTPNLPERIADAMEDAKAIDWRLHDLTITPAPRNNIALKESRRNVSS